MTSPVGLRDDAGSEPSVKRAWPVTLVVLLAVLGAFGFLFSHEAAGAYGVWTSSTAYNHCFLIAPLSLYLIWDRRRDLAGATPRANFLILALLPILSLLWLVTASLDILEAQQLAAMTIVQVSFCGILGWPVYRRLMAPLLYLYFLVPSGNFLVPTLQDLTTRFVVGALHLVGVPVFSDGVFIEVPAGHFMIAEACAGLRFLIASVAFGVFYAILTYDSRIRRTLFIAIAIAVPVVANWFRAFGIVIAAELIGDATAVEADHIIYGWGFFTAILIALILIGRIFSDRSDRPRTGTAETGPGPMPARAVVAGLACVILAGAGPGYAVVLDRQGAGIDLEQVQPPVPAPPWHRIDGAANDWQPMLVRPDKVVSETFSDGQATVYRVVAFYVAHGRVNNLIRSDDRIADNISWQFISSHDSVIHLMGRDVTLRATEIAGPRRSLVWSYYAVDGDATSDVLMTKLNQARGLFTGQQQISAFVAVATDVTGGEPPESVLKRFFDAMAPQSADWPALPR